jgi:hypothetical protein
VTTVLAVTHDLFWLGKIRNTAAKVGLEVRVPVKPRITEYLLDEATRLVLVDLHDRKHDFVETIRLVRGTRWDTRLICFGHHTDADRMAKARDTGAKEVWANSELDARLAEVMAEAKASHAHE